MSKYSSYILYLLLAILVAILSINDFGPLASVQRSMNDMLCSITASDNLRQNVVLVRIDEQSQEEFGPLPWDHDLIADLTAAIASGEPKVIVEELELSEDAYQDSAGYTDILAQQLKWIPQVVLRYDIALATFRSNKTSNPERLFQNSVVVENPLGLMDESSSLLVRKVFLPADKLLTHKPYMGFHYHRPDNDRLLRYQPLLMNFEGFYYPSTSLIASAVYLDVPTDQIKVIENQEIQLGAARTVPINGASEFYINYAKGIPFLQYSAASILKEGFVFDNLKGKVVIICPGREDVSEIFTTPVDDATSSAIVKATVIENIINNNMLDVRDDLATVNLLILLGLGGLCAFLLPRVNTMYRLVILGGALFLLLNANYLLFANYRMVIETVYIAFLLVLCMVASPMLDSELLTGKKREARQAAEESKLARAKARAAKRREATPEEVKIRELRELPGDPVNIETRALASDSDRVAHAADSAAIDHQTISLDDGPPAPAEPPVRQSDSQPIGAADSGGFSQSGGTSQQEYVGSSDPKFDSGDHFVISKEEFDSQGVPTAAATPDLQNLGRYQVNGILGKGAMGTVYKGIDPAINRPVALKTIRLDFVTDPEELAELKERLHREAQAAGKLSHPNIVTIYDVGSEGSLQYIAMEYLEGQTLENLIKKKVRFNYRIIAQIISQICAALEYAHERGIVHRDIKPANIMVLSDYRVKVMDYGIARVDSNSMTKTGIAMGTPNYISPEQLKGLATDRRADLFSLGVVMYEMLLGKRPFKGENITSLMYAIMNKDPEKPSTVNPQVPLLFDHIILRALKKVPQERYQRASEIQADLKDFVESFAR